MAAKMLKKIKQTEADLLEGLTPSSPATPLELFMLKNIKGMQP